MANPGDVPEGASPHTISIARARAQVQGIEDRVARADPAAALPEVEELLTSAAGLRLTLEAERLQARRRATALQDEPDDAARLGSLEELHERQELLGAELARLDVVIDDLRAAHARLSGARR